MTHRREPTAGAPRRVVVAGAGGYVGGRLVAALAARPGVDPVALVRRRRPWLAGGEQVELDLLEPGRDLAGVLAGADAVVHLAGPSELVAAHAPATVLADTVAISAALGAAAVAADVGRVVYLSTTHVYGARAEPGAVLTEDLRPEPRHPYAIARLASEHVLAGLDVDLVALRLTNTVGAPADVAVDRWSLVVNDLCRQAACHRVLRLRSDGLQWRDFVALGDAVEVVADVALGAGRAGTWNLGSGSSTTVRAVAGLVADAWETLTGHRPPLEAPDPGGPPTEPHVVDVGALAALGLCCRSPLPGAVAEVAAFCAAHRGTLGASVS